MAVGLRESRLVLAPDREAILTNQTGDPPALPEVVSLCSRVTRDPR